VELADYDPSVNVEGPHHAAYIEDVSGVSEAIWRVSTWHRNMNEMQLGSKGLSEDDRPGWEVYEAARRAGAIVHTAHEHSYSRSHRLSDVESQTFEPPAGSGIQELVLQTDSPGTPGDEGRTFVFVSGLGGKEVRSQQRDGSWWGARYTTKQSGRAGALFGVFHYAGDPRLAYFYFKDVDGVIVDDFYVRSHVGADHVLTVNTSGAGRVELEPPGGKYAAGQQVTVRAVPERGLASDFLGWSGALSGATLEQTLTIGGDISVTAEFKPATSASFPLTKKHDDAEEDDGEVDTGDDDLDMEDEKLVGLRFDNVVIPAGSAILEARIQLTADDTASERTVVKVLVENRADAEPFDEDEDDGLSDRSWVTAASWDIPLWLKNAGGRYQATPNLREALQAVVDRADWVSGNAVAFLLEQEHDDGERDAIAYDEKPQARARLVVRYFPPE
jgi:hypothetical protein